MKRHFEEVQSFRENRWIWYIIVISLLMPFIPLLNGAYTQLVMNQPWGNEPMSNEGLIALVLFIFLTWCLMTWMLMSTKLEVYIDDEGIHYRFYPIRAGWKLLEKKDIVAFEVSRKRNFFRSGGIGYHRSLVRRSVSMRIHGWTHIRFTLANKHVLILGTQRPEEFERGIKRMMTPDI